MLLITNQPMYDEVENLAATLTLVVEMNIRALSRKQTRLINDAVWYLLTSNTRITNVILC